MISETQLLIDTPSELTSITKKVLDGTRLSIEDGFLLFSSFHEEYISRLASYVRQKKVGCTVSYSITLHLYPSNICFLECPICSFYAKEGDSLAFVHNVEYLCSKVKERLSAGITQVHIVSGLYRELTLDYYKNLFTSIRTIAPSIEIKALSAVEYDYLATISHCSVRDILQEMKSYGLSFLPGGGAEIFDTKVREQIAPRKLSGARYIEIHKTAHELGILSNCTVLYNHIEKPIHILNHLHDIRSLQDETKGIVSFVPLRYHPGNNCFGKNHLPKSPSYRLYPICRLMLDNIDHLCCLWNYEGIEVSTKLLHCGVSNIGNVIYEEQVACRAKATSCQIDEETLQSHIKTADRYPKKQEVFNDSSRSY